MIRRTLKLLRRTARRMAPRPKRPTVLVYHGVVDQKVPDAVDHWSLTVDEFAAHVNWMRQHWQVIPIDTLIRAIAAKEPLSPRWLCITFDDAFTNVLRNAHPILQGFQLPYTIAAPTDLLGSQRTVWSLEVRLATLEAERAVVPGSLFGREEDLPLHSPPQRVAAASQLVTALMTMPDARRQTCLAELIAWLLPAAGDNTVRRHPELSIMSPEELCRLARDGVTIASHGCLHSPLNDSADDACLEREVTASRQKLEALLGRPVETFVFPFGEHTPASLKAVQSAGYKAALLADGKAVSAEAGCYRISRLGLDNGLRHARRILA